MIIVNNAAFPINVVYALSEDFHFEQPLKEDKNFLFLIFIQVVIQKKIKELC